MIMKSGNLDDCSIYVVSAGEIQVTLKRDEEFDEGVDGEEKIVKILKKGEIFGEVSFFTGEARRASAKSVDFGQLYKISRQDFIQLLKGRYLDEEKFAVLKDSLLLYKQYEKIGLKCYVCENQNHLSYECNKIHLSLNKRKVLLPELRNYEQMRSLDYKRESRKHRMTRVNTFQVQKDCWIALEQFIQNNYEEIDQYEIDFQINDYSITFEEDEEINNILNPNTHFQNIIEQSGDDEDSCISHHHIINQQKRNSITGNLQQHSQQQNKEHPQHQTAYQPTINQYLPITKQQIVEGKNFHDYLEIFNKEMRIQQKSSSKLRKQSSMQTVNLLKEMNKQRQGSQQKKSKYQNEETQKLQDKTGDFLHPKDKKDHKGSLSSYRNENTQNSFPSSNNISDSDEEKNITDENKKNIIEDNYKNFREENKRCITDENRRSLKSENKINFYERKKYESYKYNSKSNLDDKYSLTEENKETIIDEDDLSSFRDKQIDEEIQNPQTRLPSINPHLNLKDHQEIINDQLNQSPIKFSKDDKNKYSKTNKLNQQRDLFNGKNLSQPKSRSHSSQKSIQQDEKQNYPSNGVINFEGVQVSLDISTPSQATSYSIGSNMRGLPSKKQVGQTEDRRVSNISSINAKRTSRDSIFFKQHNLPYVFNSPYKQSPNNNGSEFNFNIQQSPYLEQNQLSTITEDLNLLDEQIGIGSINQQIFSAFLKRSNQNINEVDNNSPQFLQLQDQESFKQNIQTIQNKQTLPIVQMRNFPSFSKQNQGSPYEKLQATQLQERQLLPQTPLSNKAFINIKQSELRRRSMFSVQNNLLEQQSRLFSPKLNFTSQKNIQPQFLPILNQQNSDSLAHQPSTNNSIFYTQQQNNKQKRRQSQRVVYDSSMLQANHFNKRSSILKNASKFVQLNTPQIQAIQQISPQQNSQNSPLNLYQMHNLGMPAYQNQDYMNPNNSLIYKQNLMGQQMNIQNMKHEQNTNQNIIVYDVMKLFKLYFITGNYDIVLSSIEQHRKKSYKKVNNIGQNRRLLPRNKKEKAFTQYSSLQTKKNLLLSLNSNLNKNLNSDIPKKNPDHLQNSTRDMSKIDDYPILKKIQSEIC